MPYLSSISRLYLGKLRVLSGLAVAKILQENGFVMVRQRGSHIILKFSNETIEISVPVPNHDKIKIGTLLSIIRQSRLPRELFETA
jgi:predicted RNA binding protein YcfA (HicA-like mRNA interferase family)